MVVKFGLVNYFVIVAYFAILIYLGYYFYKRDHSEEAYFLGNQNIPWWAAGLSIYGTQLSAITFMAIPATAFATNWVYIFNQFTIILIAPMIVYFYLPFFKKNGIRSAYEYLESRFDRKVRLFGASAFVLFQLGRMAIVIYLPAIALTAVTGIDLYIAILLIGLLSTLYTTIGGIEAVIWSDVLQVFVLLGGALLSLILLINNIDGGISGFVEAGSSAEKFRAWNLSGDWTTTALWVIIIGNCFSNLVPYTSDQTVIQRYLSTGSQKDAARSIWTNAFMTLPTAFIFFTIGTALWVFYQQNPSLLDATLSQDAIFPFFIVSELPQGVSGLLIAGIFAASMSSLDSSLNSIATVSVTDFLRIPKNEGRALGVAKKITLGLGSLATLIGLALATFEIRSLYDVFLELLSTFGGSLAGLFALGMFTKKANARGALLGAFLGIVAIVYVKNFTDIHFFLYSVVGISSCFIFGYLASILWRKA